jgi:single-strand DNA-binding protein
MNLVVLTGRLVADPQSKFLQSGKMVVSMRIAVDRGKDQPSDFIDLSAFDRTAEFASKYLAKGRKLCVTGKLRTREYQTDGGEKRRAFEILCDNLEPLDSMKEGGAPSAAPQQQAVQTDDIEDPFG